MQKPQTHLPALIASILFALSGLFLLGIGLLMGFAAFYTLLGGKPVQTQQTILFVAFGFEALLLFAAAFFVFQKTLHHPSADRSSIVLIPRLWVVIAVLLASGAILIGSLVGRSEPLNWLLLPILTVPAIVLPLGVLLALGAHSLPLGTRWESWSVLGLGMTLTPLLLLALEIAAGIFVLIGAIALIALQPELAAEIQGLSQQIMILGPQSEAIGELLSPFLTRPGVIITALLYIAFLVPAIEELLKPLGVWLLAGKLDSVAQGFTLGALSGAGYGLIETIGVSGQAGGWATLLLTRIGTGLLHITTSALMGAAIVLAWRERRYLRWLGTYFLAVLLHGLWNASAILYTFSSLAEFLEQPGKLGTIQLPIIVVMSVLATILFATLLLSNRRMRRIMAPALPEPSLPANPLDQSP